MSGRTLCLCPARRHRARRRPRQPKPHRLSRRVLRLFRRGRQHARRYRLWSARLHWPLWRGRPQVRRCRQKLQRRRRWRGRRWLLGRSRWRSRRAGSCRRWGWMPAGQLALRLILRPGHRRAQARGRARRRGQACGLRRGWARGFCGGGGARSLWVWWGTGRSGSPAPGQADPGSELAVPNLHQLLAWGQPRCPPTSTECPVGQRRSKVIVIPVWRRGRVASLRWWIRTVSSRRSLAVRGPRRVTGLTG
ncbi:hypothetical protein HDA44_003098 [Kribbella solani]|uniref:Uncharacterized protein n=1 Tax=Kribbella solani TaxID=236067 RepID=A0A841DTY9_9ACTN|nr:hypothetical protein [Kribbella solani]